MKNLSLVCTKLPANETFIVFRLAKPLKYLKKMQGTFPLRTDIVHHRFTYFSIWPQNDQMQSRLIMKLYNNPSV